MTDEPGTTTAARQGCPRGFQSHVMCNCKPATAASGTGADHDCGDAGECPLHDALAPAAAARHTSRVWRCMGCGTIYRHDETHRCSSGAQWAALVLVALVVFAFVWIGAT